MEEVYAINSKVLAKKSSSPLGSEEKYMRDWQWLTCLTSSIVLVPPVSTELHILWRFGYTHLDDKAMAHKENLIMHFCLFKKLIVIIPYSYIYNS